MFSISGRISYSYGIGLFKLFMPFFTTQMIYGILKVYFLSRFFPQNYCRVLFVYYVIEP